MDNELFALISGDYYVRHYELKQFICSRKIYYRKKIAVISFWHFANPMGLC